MTSFSGRLKPPCRSGVCLISPPVCASDDHDRLELAGHRLLGMLVAPAPHASRTEGAYGPQRDPTPGAPRPLPPRGRAVQAIGPAGGIRQVSLRPVWGEWRSPRCGQNVREAVSAAATPSKRGVKTPNTKKGRRLKRARERGRSTSGGPGPILLFLDWLEQKNFTFLPTHSPQVGGHCFRALSLFVPYRRH